MRVCGQNLSSEAITYPEKSEKKSYNILNRKEEHLNTQRFMSVHHWGSQMTGKTHMTMAHTRIRAKYSVPSSVD